MPSIEKRTKANGEIYFRARYEWKDIPDINIEYDNTLSYEENRVKARMIANDYEKKYNVNTELLFTDLAVKYIHDSVDVSDNTRSDYLRYTRDINSAFGKKKVKEITVADIQDYLVKLRVGKNKNNVRYRIKEEIKKVVLKKNLSKALISRESGVPRTSVFAILNGEPVIEKNAELFSKYFNYSVNEAFVAIGEQKKRSAKTVANYYAFISPVFKYAMRLNIIDQNPMDKVDKPKQNKEKNMYPLTLEEKDTVLKLLEYESIQFKTIITIMLSTGVRRGEVLAFSWSDLELNTPDLFVHRAVKYIEKKGLSFKKPKNDKYRRVPLTNKALEVLLEYQKYQKNLYQTLGKEWNQECLIFGSLQYNNLGGIIHPDTLSGWWRSFAAQYSDMEKPVKKRAEYAKKYHFKYCRLHDLRHTYATLLIQSKKLDITTVSKYMGHSSIQTTLNTYTHYFEDIRQSDIDAINSII